MAISTARLETSVEAARGLDGADPREMTRDALLDGEAAAAAVMAAAKVVYAAFAAEISLRSTGGAIGLARQEGFSTAERMIGSRAGVSPAEARRLVEAGLAMLPPEPNPDPGPDPDPQPNGTPDPSPADPDEGSGEGSDDDEDLDDAPLSPVGEALRAGLIGPEAASLIVQTLEGMDDAAAAVIEERLVKKAFRLDIPDLRRACQRERESYDHQRFLEDERRRREARHLLVRQDADGMVTLTGRFDAATALPIVAWLDAQVKDSFQRRRDRELDDHRTAGQIRADVLADLAQHGLDCSSMTTGVKTTVVVHVDLEDLRRGSGLVDTEHLSTRLSIESLRAMLADAGVIPAVMGGPSVPLDLGRRERLFTRYQKLALARRDGGCAWCRRPPAWCDAHHILDWSKGGRTDLSNGVLLCRSCHVQLHATGWEIVVKDGQVWFIPPPEVDPSREPRIGGSARVDSVPPDTGGPPPTGSSPPISPTSAQGVKASAPTRGAPAGLF
ncbi:HNH endonuclease [Demequina rhizosphaerae]|uniref:HNH endonuclease n=1 Tax=Demequina rhizosphaerae TaxID=1638985 RepID=UPI0007836C05|nr:HNH endonuclease signature motif containing protein [Demequina rhizosphaerae]